MKQTFTILSKSPHLPQPWPRRRIGRDHPHHYHIQNAQGDVACLLSKRDDYQPGDTVTVDIFKDFWRGGGIRHYADPTTPGTMQNYKPPVAGEIDSDVIVMVSDVKTNGGLSTVTGTVFYFDPRLINLTDVQLRKAFNAKANPAISVTTSIHPYFLNVGHVKIFGNLRDVTVSNGVIRAKDACTP